MDFEKFLALLKALAHEGVDYVLVGGVALNVHGIVRATEDVDRSSSSRIPPPAPSRRWAFPFACTRPRARSAPLPRASANTPTASSAGSSASARPRLPASEKPASCSLAFCALLGTPTVGHVSAARFRDRVQ